MIAALVWIGAAMTLAGLAGLGWCVRLALRLRREGAAGDGARKAIAKIQAINLAAMATAFLGLGLVAAGLILG